MINTPEIILYPERSLDSMVAGKALTLTKFRLISGLFRQNGRQKLARTFAMDLIASREWRGLWPTGDRWDVLPARDEGQLQGRRTETCWRQIGRRASSTR